MSPTPTIIAPPCWTQTLPLGRIFADDDAPPQAAEPLARQPLWVDIGCGKGRFLLAMAARHPTMSFLGVDRLLARLRLVERRAVRAALPNVRLLRAEALYTVQHLLPPQSVRVFSIFFPDPWPKRRHHRRRLFTSAFLGALHQAAAPQGVIHIATDDADYFQAIRKLFRADARFGPTGALEPDAAARTNFEIVFQRQGTPIHRAAYVRS
jgi:tRNA (guanine-N7-)-methyltransferase